MLVHPTTRQDVYFISSIYEHRFGWLEEAPALRENIDKIWQAIQLNINEVKFFLDLKGKP
jgi:hypothetical protein